MTGRDPIGVAAAWFDAYRNASPTILDLYGEGASLECGCGGYKMLVGRVAMAEYWRQRFINKPAGELKDIHPLGNGVVVFYRSGEEVVQAILRFDADGLIANSRCGPLTRPGN